MPVLYVILAAVMVASALGLWFLPQVTDPSIAFGVRIPPERRSDPAVVTATGRYRLGLAISLMIGLVLLFAVAWPRVGVAGPQLLFLVLFFLNYLVARHQVLTAKQAGQWFQGLRQGTAAATDPDRGQGAFPWLYLAPALVLLALTLAIAIASYRALPALIPVHFNLLGQPTRYAAKSWASALLPVWLELLVTGLITAASWFSWRSPRQINPSQPAASLRRSWQFRARMVRLILLLATAVDLMLFISGLSMWHILQAGPSLRIALVLIPLVAAAILVVSSYRMGQEGVRMAAPREAPTGLVARDDDRLWKGGMLYFNPQDPAILVPKRFGIGWTLNFGHWLAWVVVPAILAVAVGLRLLILRAGLAHP